MPKTNALRSPRDIGQLIAATRTAMGETQASFAANIGVGERTLRAIEHGKPGVALGTVLSILADLGIELTGTTMTVTSAGDGAPRARASGRPIGRIKT